VESLCPRMGSHECCYPSAFARKTYASGVQRERGISGQTLRNRGPGTSLWLLKRGNRGNKPLFMRLSARLAKGNRVCLSRT